MDDKTKPTLKESFLQLIAALIILAVVVGIATLYFLLFYAGAFF